MWNGLPANSKCPRRVRVIIINELKIYHSLFILYAKILVGVLHSKILYLCTCGFTTIKKFEIQMLRVFYFRIFRYRVKKVHNQDFSESERS